MTACRLRTVGLLAALVLLALSANWALSSASAQGPAVSVSSINANVGVVSKVDVRALAMPAPGLAAWKVDVHYDPSLVTVLGCTAAQNGICNSGYDSTTVRVTGTTLNGLQGDTALASIALVCAAAGQGQLEASISVLADGTLGDPQPIAATAENGAVSCTSGAAPTPTSSQGSQPTATPPSSEPKLPGDADCSHVVNPVDAALVLQDVAGFITGVPCPDDGNYNHDGAIDAIDAALILQRSAGLI